MRWPTHLRCVPASEERNSTKRNAGQTALHRIPSRIKCRSRGLHGVREAARNSSTLKFTALLHHINEDCLTEAFFNLKKTAAVGVDGVTWHEYERNLEANIADLHGLLIKFLEPTNLRSVPDRRSTHSSLDPQVAGTDRRLVGGGHRRWQVVRDDGGFATRSGDRPSNDIANSCGFLDRLISRKRLQTAYGEGWKPP